MSIAPSTTSPHRSVDAHGRALPMTEDEVKARAELAISALDALDDMGSEEEQREYLLSMGLSESGLERLIKTAYEKLGLISFLTAGEKEVRAWTIKNSSTAPEAAGSGPGPGQ